MSLTPPQKVVKALSDTGLTQAQIADRLGCCQQNVSKHLTAISKKCAKIQKRTGLPMGMVREYAAR